ncbi:hypothetical protein ACJX0J_041578, partial [Zea mays]
LVDIDKKEMEMIKDLPEELKQDIKRYLCLELVSLFHGMDDLILDNIHYSSE